MKKTIKVLVLAILLLIISATVILLSGNKYTIRIPNAQPDWNLDDVKITMKDDKIIKLIDKKIENGELKINIKSISEGKSYIDVIYESQNLSKMYSIYVHKFGIITFNEFMGDCSGSIIIPISIAILLSYVLYLLIKSYRESIKESLYQYKNIAYLGLIIFISFTIISQIWAIFNYSGLINTINGILSLFSFYMVFLPIALIMSVLVIISNISLIRKEGFNLTNSLGICLGIFLCLFSILPELMYKGLYSATWIDIHNQNGIGLYIYNLVETLIYIIITYIECVLIGTIIIGIKSAKRIPKFDKDAIIILGCQIKKDGSLTNLLKSRVDRAIEFAKMQKEKTNKDIYFIPSGGKGNDEIISEAEAMKNYLLEQGIAEERILIDNKSKNTYENIKFSNNIINKKIKKAKVAFSTTNYHVFRAGNIAHEQNLNFEGIGAKTKMYFEINAFIREFIATLFNEKKKHILAILSIIAVSIIMIIVTYLNGNL